MKISGVDIRPGNIIEYEKGIWRAVKIQHTQPGKGGAYMQVEMKNLIDGRKTNVRFRSAETVERVRLDTKDYQYLYHDGDMLVFMDKDTYEQVSLPEDLVGEAAAFANGELRWSFGDAMVGTQHLRFMLVPYVDTGRVFDSVSGTTLADWKFDGGIGFRLAWNLSTVVSFDYARSGEGTMFYMELGHQF